MEPASRVGIVGIPYDEKSSYLKGAAKAPDLIRAAYLSPASNVFSESGKDTGKLYQDLGDLQIKDYFKIEAGITDKFSTNPKLITLGGDHSITYPVVLAFSKHYPVFDILHFDAHSDLYDIFKEDKYSHACPFARIMEDGLAGRLVQVGIRTQTDHLRQQAQKFGVEILEMKNLQHAAQIKFNNPVYISIDMDAFDPGWAPGVAHQEAGGLFTRDVLNIIQKIEVPVIGADIVEYIPDRDIAGITANLAAKLLKELIDRIHDSQYY